MTDEVVVTVQAAANSYDLLDLPTAKDELGLNEDDTSSDAWLARGISQVSRAMATYCNRIFVVEAVTEVLYCDYQPRSRRTRMPSGDALQLSRWPILSVSSVTAISAPGSDAQTLVAGVDYLLNADLGQLVRLSTDDGALASWNDAKVTVSYVAGYGALAAQAATVPATPFVVTVTEASSFSIDQGVTYATGGALTKVSGTPAQGQYAVDAATGKYTFAVGDVAQAVLISYGYNIIPADLVDAALKLITQRFRGKGRDPMQMTVSQPGIGDQRFWVGGAPGQNGAFPPEIQGILDNYRVPVVA